MKLSIKTLAVAAAVGALASSNALAANFFITYEAAGVVNTTATFDYKGVENFEGLATGTGQTFTSNYGTDSPAFPVKIEGTYKGVEIRSADRFGGANGTGQYAVALRNGSTYELSLSTTPLSKGLNYFGYWLSALDRGNTVTFYDGVTDLGSFDASSVLGAVKSDPLYKGNPFDPFKGQNSGEPYAFVNFYAAKGVTFNRIVFTEVDFNGGYESDNHTVGYYKETGGVSPIPEPSTYALMIAGLAGVGFMARRRSAKV